MKRLVLVPLVVILAAALSPPAALGKGASAAEITGPGLDDTITLKGHGEGLGDPLERLAEAAGFFPAVFATTPDPMLSKRPSGALGPRYSIAWIMPAPDRAANRLRQDVYPYARPTPVTYMASGLPFFGTEQTHGGWFVAATDLRDLLVDAGLPETAPSGGDGSGLPWLLAGGLAILGTALGVSGLVAFIVRRRPETPSTV